MSTLWGNNIAHLLDITGRKGAHLARSVGVKPASVSDWQSGKSKGIDGENLLRVAEYFGVSADRLMHEDLSGLTVNDLKDPRADKVTVRMRRIPVVGTAQMGDDGYWSEFEYPVGHGDGSINFPTSDPNAFGLYVRGDSMRPRYKPGEIVIVEPGRQSEPGHEVVVKTRDGRVMVKVFDWRRNGLVQFSSVNESHRPVTVPEQEVEFIYRVTGFVQADTHRF